MPLLHITCLSGMQQQKHAFGRFAAVLVILIHAIFPVALADKWGFVGCFQDNNDRDLSMYSPKGGGFTVASCRTYAEMYDMKYFALQLSLCFIDNTYATPADTYVKRSDSECGSECSGESAKDHVLKCGSNWRNAVYRTKDIKELPVYDIEGNGSMLSLPGGEAKDACPKQSWRIIPGALAMPCVKVVTGTNQGKLILRVNAGLGLQEEASGVFPAGAVVLDRCYWQDVVQVQVQNKDGDSWTGSILYSLDSGKAYQTMRCTNNCAGNVTHTGAIQVGSSGVSLGLRNSCLNGEACSLTVYNPELYCIRFTTCSSDGCEGWISISVDLGAGFVAQGGELELQNDAVWESCYGQDVEAVQVTSAKSDKWRGAAESSRDGGLTYASMVCANCSSGSDAANLVVTPSGSDIEGSAKCLNSGPCALQQQQGVSTTTSTTLLYELQTWAGKSNGWSYLGHNGTALSMFTESHVGTRWLVEKQAGGGVKYCSFKAIQPLEGGGQYLSHKGGGLQMAANEISAEEKWVIDGFC